MYRFLTSLDELILNYFVVYYGIISDIIFFISLSDGLLLVCRNTTDYFMLIFYSATLLNLFISSNSFLIESFSLSYIYNMEKAMAPHSSTVARKIPWVEEPGRLQSHGVAKSWT